jgi:hypothetical protein
MRSLLLGIAALAVAAVAFQAVGQEGAKLKAQRPGPPPTSFAEDVFPIFKGRCIDCHQPGGPGYEASGLDL